MKNVLGYELFICRSKNELQHKKIDTLFTFIWFWAWWARVNQVGANTHKLQFVVECRESEQNVCLKLIYFWQYTIFVCICTLCNFNVTISINMFSSVQYGCHGADGMMMALRDLPFAILFPIHVSAPQPSRFRSSKIDSPLWSARTLFASFRALWNPLAATRRAKK